MNKYEKKSTSKLFAIRDKVQAELLTRTCHIGELKWNIQIVDDTIPYVVRRGENYWKDDYDACFAVMSKDWWNISGRDSHIPQPDEASLRAARNLCYWLSGVDNQELRAARHSPEPLETFAYGLLHPGTLGSESLEVEEEYRICLTSGVDEGLGIGVEAPRKVSRAPSIRLMLRCFEAGVPPGDDELRLCSSLSEPGIEEVFKG